MKTYTPLLLVVLLLSSCINSNQNTIEVSTKADSDPGSIEEKDKLQDKILDFKIYGCYKLDDKYSTNTNSEEIEKWLESRIEQIKSSSEFHDILGHSGGGPNGAEWNPSTDIFLFITGVEDTVKITINDKPLKS